MTERTAETPASGILKVNEWGESVWYHVRCECNSDDCSHEVNIEADEVEVSVHIYTKNHTRWWAKNRWQQIWQILTRGYAEMETTIVLREQTAINYAAALTNAVDNIRVLRARNKDKQDNKNA